MKKQLRLFQTFDFTKNPEKVLVENPGLQEFSIDKLLDKVLVDGQLSIFELQSKGFENKKKDTPESLSKFTHESTKNDSCVNPQLTSVEHDSLLSYLTQKNTAQRKYGSGWLSLTKAGGTARTDNKYLVYYYRQHWRKRPYAVHIGNQYRHQVLEIGRKVREAIDRDRSPLEIEKMIKDAKSNSK